MYLICDRERIHPTKIIVFRAQAIKSLPKISNRESLLSQPKEIFFQNQAASNSV